jgi:CRP-like cAMP-binding protein
LSLVSRKLERRTRLTVEEVAALARTFATVRPFEPDHDVMVAGARPGFVGVMIEGFLARYASLPDGQRQIVGLILPGDMFDLQSLLFDQADHNIATLTRCRIATASRAALGELMTTHPRLTGLFWLDAAIESATFREWVVNTGRRTAYAATAHLLCEIFHRQDYVGLTRAGGCALPFTQARLGDCLGLSVVHVNRVLKGLRAEGLIAIEPGRLIIRDQAALAAAAGFNPDYLHPNEELMGRDGLFVWAERRGGRQVAE